MEGSSSTATGSATVVASRIRASSIIDGGSVRLAREVCIGHGERRDPGDPMVRGGRLAPRIRTAGVP
jgi:hypothetical protein